MKKLFLIFVSLVLFSACSTSGDVAMKIGNVEIKKEFIDYFENSYNTQSGGTVSETVSKKARSQAQLYGNVMAIGKRMDLNPDHEYEQRVEAVIENYGSVEEYLEQADISKEVFDFLMYGTSYQTLVLDEFIKTKGITDEAIEEYFLNNFFRAKHLLLLTEGKTGWEKSDVKKEINKLLERAQDGEDFDKLIEKYNQDPGVKNVPDGYVFTYNEMVPEFFEAVSESDFGEYSMVETSYGYHVIKRLPLDETPELFENLIDEKKIDICQAMIVDKFFVENFWRVKQILLSTEDKNVEQISEIKDKAEEIYNKISEGADFDELMEKYNEDKNVDDNPYGYIFTYDEMVPEFFEAATTIDYGEYNLVETMYGFHIIRRLAFDDPPEMFNEFKNSRLEKIYENDDVNINKLFLDFIESKLEEYDIGTRDYTGSY